MIRAASLVAILALLGCTPTPPTPEEAAARCEERAQAAQGPEVGLRVGANSETGAFGGASISLSSDFLRGRDPLAVYEECVLRLTGEAPIRPPALRVQ